MSVTFDGFVALQVRCILPLDGTLKVVRLNDPYSDVRSCKQPFKTGLDARRVRHKTIDGRNERL